MSAKKNTNLRVVLTRQNNDELSLSLTKLGVDVLEIPLIDTIYGVIEDDAADFFNSIATYDWATFASPNGVRGFFKEFFKKFADIRCIGPMRIACVGEATAKMLAEFHLASDIVASPQNADTMADAMLEFESLDNRNILCVGGNLSNKAYIKKLEEKGGAMAEFFEVYKTIHLSPKADDKIVKDFKKFGADYIVFASSSAVESFVKNAKTFSLEKGAAAPKAISIGPSTTESIKKYNIPLAYEAKEASVDGILAVLKNIVK